MKMLKFDEIKKGDKLIFIIHNEGGDNPILCRKEDFNIDSAPLSTKNSVLEITIDNIFLIQKTFKLVEK